MADSSPTPGLDKRAIEPKQRGTSPGLERRARNAIQRPDKRNRLFDSASSNSPEDRPQNRERERTVCLNLTTSCTYFVPRLKHLY
jgi:hypothetical protein